MSRIGRFKLNVLAVVLIGMVLVTALCSTFFWMATKRLRWPGRHLAAVAGGIFVSPSNWGAGVIYWQESGGGDSDPLVIFLLVLAASVLISVVTVAVLDARDNSI